MSSSGVVRFVHPPCGYVGSFGVVGFARAPWRYSGLVDSLAVAVRVDGFILGVVGSSAVDFITRERP